MESLSHVAIPVLIFRGPSTPFSIAATPIYLPTHSAHCSCFSTPRRHLLPLVFSMTAILTVGGGHFCRLDRRFFEHDQRVPESGLPFRLPRMFFPDTCVTSSLASLRPLLKRLTSLRMSESLPWFPIYFCGGVFLRYLNQYDTRTYASFGFCH